MLFKGSREFVPLYALYALLFADHGLTTAQISSMFALWSITSFVLEVPSGAWADTVSRRGLLVLSGALVAAAFTVWTAAPSYLGFALGFVLWGVAGALESGTFEALIYDDLAARERAGEYARVMGYARAAAEGAVVVAILAAAPLYALGGYGLVGWASVAIALAHTALACGLPSVPKAGSVAEIDAAPEPVVPGHPPVPGEPRAAEHSVGERRVRPVADADSGPPARAVAAGGAATTVAAGDGVAARYLRMLRAGVGETVRTPRIRRAVLLGSMLFGITAYDEYFALLAQSVGVPTAVVPVLIGVTVVGSMTGTLLAGRTSGWPGRGLAVMVAVGGLLFVAGALVAGLAAGRPGWVYPLTAAGFIALGVGYGAVLNAEIVADARPQDAIEGPARATVTSVSGLLAEVVALAVFGLAALAATWLSMAVTLAVLGALMLGVAALTPSWLPRPAADPATVDGW